jgi:hypothetical protein
MRTILLTLLLSALAMAADVSGKWLAKVPGRDGNTRDVTYNFKVDGSNLTGTTTGFQGNEIPLSDGKVDGDTITFKTRVEFNGNAFVMNYTGKVAGDEIKFTSKREGSDQTREFTAKRSN